MPQGYKNGGKVKAFGGKDNPKEERAEAREVRSGKVSPAQYAAKEKAEGEKASTKSLQATGKQLASGKLSADQYANRAKMANGGYVCGGVRSNQDYGK